MPDSKYIQLNIAGRIFDIPQNEDFPLSITTEIEDQENFEQKKGTSILGLDIPCTLENSSSMNTYFNPMSEDLSPDNFNINAQPFSLTINGNEVMVGKAIINNATSTSVPVEINVDLFANNGDLAIATSELTLHDVVSDVTHIFDFSGSGGAIDSSWYFDGTVEDEDFVYAPVRYRDTFASGDLNIPLNELKPALFVYWLLYRGFKKAGYKIKSNFFDTNYFRRLTMPWTWGDFLSLKIEVLKCKASMNGPTPVLTGAGSGPVDVLCSNDSTLGNFDNGLVFAPPLGCYNYDGVNFNMLWFYLSGITPSPGIITASFDVLVHTSWQIPAGLITAFVTVEWKVNGTLLQTDTIFNHTSALLLPTSGSIEKSVTFVANGLVASDVVAAQVKFSISGGSSTTVAITFVQFKTNYFRAQTGSVVDFKQHDNFKAYKWLDFFRGIRDTFNLQFQTDSIQKVIYIEPTDEYSLDSTPIPTNAGYYSGDLIDWTDKRDLSKKTKVENFSDYEQNFQIEFQNDDNDGILKILSERTNSNLSQASYFFPSRFKKGVKKLENAFFSSTIHYRHDPFTAITGVAPQLICILPENISNTSRDTAESIFTPKLAWYKGYVDESIYGGWRLDGIDSFRLPFMFAVNYFAGGADDPILSYCDQNIGSVGDTPVKAMGLFKRFFWQRFAIMRHGKRISTNIFLNNSEAYNYKLNEYVMLGNGKYKCIQINGYKPLLNESTECTFWLWYPITQKDYDNTFPSHQSVMNDTPLINTPDRKYNRLMCFIGDINASFG